MRSLVIPRSDATTHQPTPHNPNNGEPDIMKPQTVHKYAGDDPTATRTACGLDIYDRMVRRYSLTINGELMYRYAASPPLVVDADVRRVTCGNCARVATGEAVSAGKCCRNRLRALYPTETTS